MDKISVLAQSPLFEMLSNSELEQIAELAQTRTYGQGELIFREGELGDSVYVIVSGEVELVGQDPTGESKVLALLSEAEFFGEMSLIDKVYRSATARARAPAELLQLSAENLTAFRKQHQDGFTFVVINIARVLSARLREVNHKLAARL